MGRLSRRFAILVSRTSGISYREWPTPPASVRDRKARSQLRRLRRERESTGNVYAITAEDFYPDVVSCLRGLREAGVLVGIAGNQPVETEHALRSMGVPADIVASSASWGIEKPDVGFFERIVAETNGLDPSQIAYDRRSA